MRAFYHVQTAQAVLLYMLLLTSSMCTTSLADPSSNYAADTPPLVISSYALDPEMPADNIGPASTQQQQQQFVLSAKPPAAPAIRTAPGTSSHMDNSKHNNLAGAQPRLDIAEISAMPDTDKYKVLMLLAWKEMTSSTDTSDPVGFWSLAGLHGMTWPWNGQVPETTTGFCRHNSPAFGPWHRPYTLMFEKGLRLAATRAVMKFENKKLRQQYMQVLPTLRLPYWDWTNPTVPSILLADNVTVINSTGHFVSIYNPFREYRYPKALDARPLVGSRAAQWHEALSKQSAALANSMRLFVASQQWKCTYDAWAGMESNNGCVGNLEQIHNDVHAIIGGLTGEMATMKYGAFDPLFWIHHATIDRALWLFQNNGGGWEALSIYSPFSNITGDASTLKSFGYTYRDPYAVQQAATAAASKPSRKLLGSSSSSSGGSSNAVDDSWSVPTGLDAGTDVGSPDAVAAVERQFTAWARGYNGYTWQVRFRRVAKTHAKLNQTVQIHVLMKGRTASEIDKSLQGGGKTLNPDLLRLRENYCGSVAGWNDGAQTVADKLFSQAVDLTRCMRAAGLDPNVEAADKSDRSKGPAAAAVKVSDLKFIVLAASGEDITGKFSIGRPVISWALPVRQQQQLGGSNMRLGGSDSTASGSSTGLYALKTGVFE